MIWKFTDEDNLVACRTLENGSMESCLVSVLPEGTLIAAADPVPEPTPAPTLVEQILASPADLTSLKQALGIA
jgi:hypothetical protein